MHACTYVPPTLCTRCVLCYACFALAFCFLCLHHFDLISADVFQMNMSCDVVSFLKCIKGLMLNDDSS